MNDADYGRGLVEWSWLETRTGILLHHATLDDQDYADLHGWAHLGLGEPGETMPRHIQLTCGRTVDMVMVPTLGMRLGAPRCIRCCDGAGLPHGDGSPHNDETCRPYVEKRMEASDG